MNTAASKSNRHGEQGESERPTSPRLTQAQRNELARAKRVALWIGLIVPLALITAAMVLLLVWMPRIPNPAATHWSGGGGPDGFGSPWSYAWMLALVGYGIVLMMWGIVAFASRMPAPSPKRVMPVWSGYQRFLTAFALGYAVFLPIALLGSVAVQLDLADAREASGVGVIMGAGFAAWALVTALGWFAQPKVDVRPAFEESVEPIPLSATERAVWFGQVRPSKGFLWIIGATFVIMLGATALVFFVPADSGDEAAKHIATIVTGVLAFVVALLCLMTAWFRVRIDARGLEARSLVGWPVFRLPAADVQRVEAAQINPMGEFGGWGLRWAPGRFGIVMRSGEGLVATRRDGRLFAITVDDAEKAAAVLAAASKRSQK